MPKPYKRLCSLRRCRLHAAEWQDKDGMGNTSITTLQASSYGLVFKHALQGDAAQLNTTDGLRVGF